MSDESNKTQPRHLGFDTRRLEGLLGRPLQRLYLRIWTPDGEGSLANMEIGLLLDFGGRDCYCFTAPQPQDGWSIAMQRIALPPASDWSAFEQTLPILLVKESEPELGWQYSFYDTKGHAAFAGLVGSPLLGVDLLSVDEEPSPFGVRFRFQGDAVLVRSNAAGSTVASSAFNPDGNQLFYFEQVGRIKQMRVGKRDESPKWAPSWPFLVVNSALFAVFVGWLIWTGMPWQVVLLKILTAPVR